MIKTFIILTNIPQNLTTTHTQTHKSNQNQIKISPKRKKKERCQNLFALILTHVLCSSKYVITLKITINKLRDIAGSNQKTYYYNLPRIFPSVTIIRKTFSYIPSHLSLSFYALHSSKNSWELPLINKCIMGICVNLLYFNNIVLFFQIFSFTNPFVIKAFLHDIADSITDFIVFLRNCLSLITGIYTQPYQNSLHIQLFLEV